MELNRENLKGYRLSYLRSLAREMGVKSPTSLIKSDLIEEIIGVSNGTISPTTVNIGRPPLKAMEIEKQEIIDKIELAQLRKIQKTCDLLSKEITSFLEKTNT